MFLASGHPALTRGAKQMPPARGGLIHRPAGHYLPREKKLWGEIATGQSQKPSWVPQTTRICGKNIPLSLLKQHVLNSCNQGKRLALSRRQFAGGGAADLGDIDTIRQRGYTPASRARTQA